MMRFLAVIALGAALPAAALAQKVVTEGGKVEVTAKIAAIDSTKRLVTLQDDKGEMETVYAGTEIKRFDELKVGDTVTFTYYESMVYQIRKPGQPATASSASGETKVVRGSGARPGGTASRQETVTVDVKAVDMKVPSITVVTPDGHTVSFKVEDKKNLKGVAAGDKVEITYTEAVVIGVK
jgi:Cu/Ag efflux protein CusF